MAGLSEPLPQPGGIDLPTNPRGALVAKTTPHISYPPYTPKATPVPGLQEAIAAFFGPEVISEETVRSLQVASGIWTRGLEMTASVVESRLNLVLNRAWQEVRQTLDKQDLWSVAQATQHVHDTSPILIDLEWLFEDSEESDVDPDGARKLLPKVRTWDMITRWAVLRAVANSLEAAEKRSESRLVIPNRLIEDEFQKVLTGKG